MIKAKVGFIVYGVHKDGLADPMGTPFIDDKLVANAKKALTDAGLELVEHDLVIASKAEANKCFAKFKKADDIDAVEMLKTALKNKVAYVPGINFYPHSDGGYHTMRLNFSNAQPEMIVEGIRRLGNVIKDALK